MCVRARWRLATQSAMCVYNIYQSIMWKIDSALRSLARPRARFAFAEGALIFFTDVLVCFLLSCVFKCERGAPMKRDVDAVLSAPAIFEQA